MKTLAFFNNKGGVGKTALVSHLAWMFADLGVPTLVVDLDPQSNLTSMFLTDEAVEAVWQNRQTIFSAVEPLLNRSGDISPAILQPIADSLWLLPGDLSLSRFEDLLADSWAKCLEGDAGAFRVIAAFHRVMRAASDAVGAQITMIDLGPNLGPLNRAALLASDSIVLPLAPDLFSLQGMRNLGPTLREWRNGWRKRVDQLHDDSIDLPRGTMNPLGYVVMSFGVRDNRPVQAYEQWLAQVPRVYREVVLGQIPENVPTSSNDPYQLAALKHHRSLMPLAIAARKPMFRLKSADGARGAHLDAVAACYDDFLQLAQKIAAETGIDLP